MALELTNHDVAHEIADRIRTLIARKDNGDVTAAARRMDRPIADLYLPERVLSSGDGAALDFLASIVRKYDADACWLITGLTAHDAAPLSVSERGAIVELLGEVSDRLIEQVREAKRARQS
ncbi:MAG TPA: hypothetical protein VFZ21_24510 [Gemmatimonadaceae bacterium]|jgi:hypothetical protein|nr:hypothetical protein [Gemmatimonadaceae bacterium]